jgi:hypothetical protein
MLSLLRPVLLPVVLPVVLPENRTAAHVLHSGSAHPDQPCSA